MHVPLFSTVTLIAELFVSAAIYYSLYQGYKHNRFPVKLAGAALLYEIIFNISYMVSRVSANESAAKVDPPFVIGLAIVHGTLSLIMFIALIVFFFFAWRRYRKGHNYFHQYKILTTLFLIFWTFSILSGILFYTIDYLIP